MPRREGALMRQESAVVLGTRVAYWRSTARHADAVMLLHGLSADHTGLLDLAAGLRGVTTIVPDLPGFGRSAPLPGRHTLDRYATVIEELRGQLELDRFALIGHSL